MGFAACAGFRKLRGGQGADLSQKTATAQGVSIMMRETSSSGSQPRVLELGSVT